MNDSIICPNCKKSIPLTQAFSQQLNAQLEDEKKTLNQKAQQWKEEQLRKMQEDNLGKQKELEQQMKKKLMEDMELKMKDSQNEKEELQKKNETLQDQLLETNKLIRQIKTENEERRLEDQKKLNEELEKLKLEERKRADEENHLKMAEKDKKLQDMMRQMEEMKRKMEQGSQQAQGEVLELEIEEMLHREFPYDEIKPVPKGVTGADIIQIVKNSHGRACGTIVWETKRTKAWSNEWISKLKEDQRQIKAELAVILTQTMPAGVKRFAQVEGVWVCEYEIALNIAHVLRSQLIDLALLKSSSVGKNEKMEVLYNYLTGIEFRQRVEAIIEAFSTMQEDIEKEKRWFAQKWSKQERSIRKVIDHTAGMHGDLQSIVGTALSDIDGLGMLPEKIEVVAEVEKETLF